MKEKGFIISVEVEMLIVKGTEGITKKLIYFLVRRKFFLKFFSEFTSRFTCVFLFLKKQNFYSDFILFIPLCKSCDLLWELFPFLF